jgi:hypothetical protein
MYKSYGGGHMHIIIRAIVIAFRAIANLKMRFDACFDRWLEKEDG